MLHQEEVDRLHDQLENEQCFDSKTEKNMCWTTSSQTRHQQRKEEEKGKVPKNAEWLIESSRTKYAPTKKYGGLTEQEILFVRNLRKDVEEQVLNTCEVDAMNQSGSTTKRAECRANTKEGGLRERCCRRLAGLLEAFIRRRKSFWKAGCDVMQENGMSRAIKNLLDIAKTFVQSAAVEEDRGGASVSSSRRIASKCGSVETGSRG